MRRQPTLRRNTNSPSRGIRLKRCRARRRAPQLGPPLSPRLVRFSSDWPAVCARCAGSKRCPAAVPPRTQPIQTKTPESCLGHIQTKALESCLRYRVWPRSIQCVHLRKRLPGYAHKCLASRPGFYAAQSTRNARLIPLPFGRWNTTWSATERHHALAAASSSLTRSAIPSLAADRRGAFARAVQSPP